MDLCWHGLDVVRANSVKRYIPRRARLLSNEVKHGRRFPKWVLQTGEVRFFNQHEHLVAIAIGRCARTPRGDKLAEQKKSAPIEKVEPYKYTAAQLEDIERAVLAEPRTGNQKLYWEDVHVGDVVPEVIRGPLSIVDIMAWYAGQQGAQPYGGVHGDALRYRQRHADFHINKTTGAKDAAGRGHLEATTGNDVGMGGAYDIGPQRISWAQHMLTNWIGDHGFLHSLDVTIRQPNLVGDTTWWRGRITKTSEVDGRCFAEVAVDATNQRGVVTAMGTASVILPSRKYGAVKFPVPQHQS